MKQLDDLVTGLQHIGIPTNKYDQTIAFYKSLGFTIVHQNSVDGTKRVAFLKLSGVVLEVYEVNAPAMLNGAIDHIALDVKDIKAVHTLVRSFGYHELEAGIQTLPFFANGVSFFTIVGPNCEKVEFSQYL